MRITLDNDACQGHGRCYALAAALFEPDDEGYAVLLEHGEVAPELESLAKLAADNCPEFAITLEP
ncbi:MAG: ferredoxin [Aquihabitans sp.]